MIQRYIDSINKPTLLVLVVFCLWAFLWLTIFEWAFSFDWLFGSALQIIMLLIVMTIALTLVTVLEWRTKFRVKVYLMILIGETLFVCLIADSVKATQLNLSFRRSESIVEKIEMFHAKLGRYPMDMAELEDSLQLRVPTIEFCRNRVSI